ncbi:TetR/AcrR family transcriptional regulator [Streptomyces fuscichromogenes]|uniref:TetR/AcrR family transcriptional regulator n=1 Tax=Streptomyces fuscichromogenes TaxID=1324013 RepID=UPI003818FA32
MAARRVGAGTSGRSGLILDSFTRRVAQFGYDGTNFSDIASELGISKGTIVHHYGTKDRLLASLHESYMRRRLAEAYLILNRLSSPSEQLAGLLFAFMLYHEHDRDATVAFQREISRLADQESLSEGVRLRGEYLELVRGVLRKGMESGQFRQGDPKIQSLLIMGSAQWAWTWFDPSGPHTADEVASSLVDMVLGGLLARPAAAPGLADPGGPVPKVVRSCFADVASHDEPAETA